MFDIETDGLLDEVTKIHTIVAYDTVDRKLHTFRPHEIDKGVQFLQGKVLVGHNILGYDIPVLKKFYPEFNYKQAWDTLILSKLIFSDIGKITEVEKVRMPSKLQDSHSLKAWGYRLKDNKGLYGEQENAWDEFSEEMLTYCIQDVKLNVKLWNVLKDKIPVKAYELEVKVKEIISKQIAHGFHFNKAKAKELESYLVKRKMELTDWFQDNTSPLKETKGYYKRPNKTRGIKAGDPIVSIKEFNPNSTQMAADELIKRGWQPTAKTPAGKWELSTKVLEGINIPFAQKLLEWRTVTKFLGMVSSGDKGWLKLVTADSRIHGYVDTLGAATHRMTHNKPNLAQIPKEGELGHKTRAMFDVPQGYKLVGCDASGLELRCLAHYLNDPEYIKQILEGDIHSHNQSLAGLPTRSSAKTFIYMLIYGGGNYALGGAVYPDIPQEQWHSLGAKMRSKFYREIPRLKEIQDHYNNVNSLFIEALDGRKLVLRESYKALNVLLQSAGAIIMKQALVHFSETMDKKGYEFGNQYALVVNVHDEFQCEVPNRGDLPKEIGEDMRQSIIKAGVTLGFNCPLDGEFAIGDNWAETH